MAGERTPDTSDNSISGRSSDDDISLREHMQRQLDSIRAHTAILLEQERVYFERVIHESRVKLDERFETAKDFNIEQDKRYEQRFAAQETAVSLALGRVDKEFLERIVQVREETHAAMDAADKAILKSESSTEKRFGMVDDLRNQLADQATHFMIRTESISRHDRAQEQIGDLARRMESEGRLTRERIDSDIAALRDRFQNDVATINSRLDRTAGTASGMDKAWGYVVAAAGLLATLVGLAAYAAGKG